MTISSLMEGGFRLIRERPGAMLIWMVIQLITAIATSFATVAILQGNMDALLSGESEQSVLLSGALKSMLLGLAGLMVSSILYAAVQRAILRPEEGGPGWLRLGMDEVRLFLLVLLYVVIFIIALFIGGIFLGAFIRRGDPVVLQLVLLVFSCLFLGFFGTRISLTFPLTLKEQAFSIGEGWRLTKGRFWTLFGTFFIIFLILLAIGTASLAVTQPEYLSAIFQHGFGSPEVEQASQLEYQKLMAGTIDAQIIIGWVLTAVQGAIGYALGGGAAATAVQQLTADQTGLTETFS
jgi:hypothetical protein